MPSAAEPGPRQRSRHRPAERVLGGTWLGFIGGLTVGLFVALAIAMFMYRAPLPFVDKPVRNGDRPAPAAEGGKVPDPNRVLYGNKGSSLPSQGPATPPPGIHAASSSGGPAQDISPDAPPQAIAPQPPAPIAPSPPPPVATPKPVEEPKTSYVLQAGAFKSLDDAEAMKARLAMMGFEARVTVTPRDGETLHRVRVGPYSAMDDLNKARSRLAENGVDASVMREKR